ncbi:MAG: ABC transporter substrate-binding protein [Clostridium sp.]|nr:ABC transporter substrate-binding protein [Clostridium sp.]
MKEKIYTIPITDAFKTECECPMCILEKKLEDESIEYILGPFLMEPEGRIQTNKRGFCKKHFELLYNTKANRLGLGLIVDTHMQEQNANLDKIYENKKALLKKDSQISPMKNFANKISTKQTETQKLVDQLINKLNELESSCAVCDKIDHTMERYVDVILFLYFKEKDFKTMFEQKKGFCLKHFKLLLEGTKIHLNTKETSIFVESLFTMQAQNLQRIQEEVNWFTQKFDYRNNDAPWKNSKDSLIRSIQKLVGLCNLK